MVGERRRGLSAPRSPRHYRPPQSGGVSSMAASRKRRRRRRLCNARMAERHAPDTFQATAIRTCSMGARGTERSQRKVVSRALSSSSRTSSAERVRRRVDLVSFAARRTHVQLNIIAPTRFLFEAHARSSGPASSPPPRHGCERSCITGAATCAARDRNPLSLALRQPWTLSILASRTSL